MPSAMVSRPSPEARKATPEASALALPPLTPPAWLVLTAGLALLALLTLLGFLLGG